MFTGCKHGFFFFVIIKFELQIVKCGHFSLWAFAHKLKVTWLTDVARIYTVPLGEATGVGLVAAVYGALGDFCGLPVEAVVAVSSALGFLA